MSSTKELDFQQMLHQPTLAHEEGLRFLRGKGLMNSTLKQLARDLSELDIEYSVIGAVALNQHGYRRFTEDIDLLMTTAGLQKFTEELVGKGYRPAFPGATRKFRATSENVPIEVIISGDYPGDGRPKSIRFPDPAEYSIEIDGIKTISLEKLIELKLASGLTGAGRRKDLADVQELMKALKLGVDLANRLDISVRPMYLELYSEIEIAVDQQLAPDWE